jgi:hypothetical protein
MPPDWNNPEYHLDPAIDGCERHPEWVGVPKVGKACIHWEEGEPERKESE